MSLPGSSPFQDNWLVLEFIELWQTVLKPLFFFCSIQMESCKCLILLNPLASAYPQCWLSDVILLFSFYGGNSGKPQHLSVSQFQVDQSFAGHCLSWKTFLFTASQLLVISLLHFLILLCTFYLSPQNGGTLHHSRK